MKNEAKLAEQILRGEEAKAILDNPLFREAWEVIEADIIKSWQNSRPDDDDTRRLHWLLQRLNRNLRQVFITYVATGKYASKELTKLKPPSNIMRAISNV